MQTHVPLDRLIQIPQAIAGEASYEGVLEAFAAKLVDILPFDHLDMVILVDGGRDHICFETPVRTDWSAFAEAPQPTGASPVRLVLNGAVPHMLSEDAFVDRRFHFAGALDRPIFEATLRSRVIVPLRVRDSVFGSINISRHRTGAYRARDLLVAQHGADLMAPYLYALAAGRARERECAGGGADAVRTSLLRLTGHLEQERRRLGMDLHDQTLGDLSRIARRIAAAGTEAGSAAGDLRPLLGELQAEIETCLTELRRIVEDARPAVLELLGFADAVDQAMRRSQSGLATPMRLRFEDRSDGVAETLPEMERTLLYRIVQEALHNAARHSGGGILAVRLSCRDGHLWIEIEDDGKGGIDPRSPGGVSHMRTRAALIGADIAFSAGRGGRGSRVGVCVPLGRGRAALAQ